jgi:hypothetical protein
VRLLRAPHLIGGQVLGIGHLETVDAMVSLARVLIKNRGRLCEITRM